MNEIPWLVTPVEIDYIEKICCSVFGGDVKLIQCQEVEGVQFNTCYRIKVANPDDEAILRIAPPDCKPLFSYERQMMSAEPHIYDLIRKAGVPMPEIIATDTSRSMLSRPFMLVRYIPSVRMNDASIPEAVKPKLRNELGRYTARIHNITGNKFGWPEQDGSIRGDNSWWTVFFCLMHELCFRMVYAEIISQEESDKILSMLESNRQIFDMVNEPRLVHNDIWDPNVLVNDVDGKWRIAAVIDADRAMFADKDMEFVLWDNADPDFLTGYGSTLDDSFDAKFRRSFYILYLAMFCSWAYKAQIWKPREYEGSCGWMRKALADIFPE